MLVGTVGGPCDRWCQLDGGGGYRLNQRVPAPLPLPLPLCSLESCTSDEETVVVDLLHGVARRLEHAAGTPAASSHRARASAAESAVQYFVVHPSLDAVCNELPLHTDMTGLC